MKETGSATANHCPQDTGGSMYFMVMRFCGEEMGELWPPMLAANAIARIRHGAKEDLGGRVRRMGRISVKQSVGAATLLIHMLAKHDTPMKASKTVLGRVPAKLSTRVIKTRSILVLLSAEEIVKPPMRSMIVGENITENMYLVASGADKGAPSLSRMTEKQTSSSGTISDVTKSGIASVAHGSVENISTA